MLRDSGAMHLFIGSNTTLALVVPTLAYGGNLYMMPKFDAARYLDIAAGGGLRTPCWCRCSTSA
jgi:hypothetical protein